MDIPELGKHDALNDAIMTSMIFLKVKELTPANSTLSGVTILNCPKVTIFPKCYVHATLRVSDFRKSPLELKFD